MAQLHPLTFLRHALIEAGYQSPEYVSLLEAAQAGWIPAEQGDSGQWVFDLADIRFIADSLMLEPIAA
jgi:hypothetical protein